MLLCKNTSLSINFFKLIIQIIMKIITINNTQKSIKDLKKFEIKKSKQGAVKGGIIIEDTVLF